MDKQRVAFCYCHFNNNNNSSELLLFIYLPSVLLVAHVQKQLYCNMWRCTYVYIHMYSFHYEKRKMKMWSLTASLPCYQIKIIFLDKTKWTIISYNFAVIKPFNCFHNTSIIFNSNSDFIQCPSGLRRFAVKSFSIKMQSNFFWR